MADVAGIVLAGGKSSRMGEDKAALPWNGKTLLEHMQMLLHEAGIANIYTSRNGEIADRIAGHGPLSGIHAALCHVQERHRYLLFVPVDMPKLTPALLHHLAAAPDCALVRFKNHMLPFRMQTGNHWQKTVETLLQGKDVSLKALQQSASLTELPVPPEAMPGFINLNTPEEWQHFKQERA